MKNQRTFVIGCVVILILLVALAIIGGVILATQVPDVSAQVPPNAAPMTITIARPLNGSHWTLDAFVPVDVVVTSEQPITTLEYWVDGALVDTQTPATDSARVWAEWTWVLGVEGGHSLIVRATAADGQIGTSNAIHVEATPPVGYNVLVPVDEGDTVESLAEAYDTTPEEIAAQNPGLDPGGGLVPGGQVLIPQAPFAMPPVGAAEPPPMPQGPVQPVGNKPPSRIGFWLGNLSGSAQAAPAAPELSYGITGCRVDLVLVDKSNDESGFFVYRIDGDSSAFRRIATLEANDGSLPLQYSDEELGESNHRDYYVAAFNGAGEAPSNPIRVDITDPACQPEGSNGLKVEEEDVILPQAMDAVYFYASINGGQYDRFPVDPRDFLIPAKDRVSYQPIIDAQLSKAPPTVEELDLEVWGWVDGTLVEVGRLHLSPAFTSLTMCSLGKYCSGDVGSTYRDTHARVAWDKEDRRHTFYWTTTAPDATGGQWQISLRPFSEGSELDATSLVATGHVEKSAGEQFMVDFREVEQEFPYYSSCNKIMAAILDQLNGQPSPCMLYTRIIPMAGNQPAGEPSNVVTIEYGPSEPIQIFIEDRLPNRYKVEIESFSLEKSPTLAGWGCVYIKELPPYQQVEDYYIRSAMTGGMDKSRENAQQDYAKWQAYMDRNEALCPMSYTPPDDDGSWMQDLGEAFEAFAGTVKDTWNLVVEAFNQAKAGLVDLAAQLIDALPGLSCNDVCRAGLRAGLEMAIAAYTGMPPSLPNFDELMDKGIDYAVELAAAEAGVPCSGECATLLREGLKDIVADLKQNRSVSQPGCVSQEVAHAWFHELLCLPPGVVTEPAPGSIYEPATVVVRVSRPSPDPLAYKQVAYEYDGQPAYAVKLTFTATNDQLVGQTLTYYYKYGGPPLPDICSSELIALGIYANEEEREICREKRLTMRLPVTEPLRGQVLRTEIIPVPPLKPGETTTIPVTLERAGGYLIPEHAAKLDEWVKRWKLAVLYNDPDGSVAMTYDTGQPTAGNWTDWQYLYYGATIEAKAEVVCLNLSEPGSFGLSLPGPDSVLMPCGSEASVVVQETTPIWWLP